MRHVTLTDTVNGTLDIQVDEADLALGYEAFSGKYLEPAAELMWGLVTAERAAEYARRKAMALSGIAAFEDEIPALKRDEVKR